jgi:hypothetical protein
MSDLCQLSIRVGREERFRQELALEERELRGAGEIIFRHLPLLEKTGRVTVLVWIENVAHIVSRSRR